MTATATDDAAAGGSPADNSSSVTYVITVEDSTAPVIGNNVQADISEDSVCSLNGAATGGATVSWTNPDVTDAAADPVTYTYTSDVAVNGSTTVTSGQVFPIGYYVITLTVSDGSADSVNDTDEFTVTVADNTAPTITTYDISIEATSENGAAAGDNWQAATLLASLECEANAIVPTYALTDDANTEVDDAYVFPLGDTSVTVTATDAAVQPAAGGSPADNNTSTETFTVTVTDETPPSFTQNTLIGDKTQESNCADATKLVAANGGSMVDWGVALAATDIYDTAVDIKYYLAADVNDQGVVAQGASQVFSDGVDGVTGTIFAIGTHTITCVADDGSAASANATDDFVIVVRDTTGPDLTTPGDYTLEAASSSGVAAGDNWIALTYTAGIECYDDNPVITYLSLIHI